MRPTHIDVHSHIAFSEFEKDRGDVLARMREKNVWVITVGTDKKHSEEAIACAQNNLDVFATVGLHPNSVITETFDYDGYKRLAENKKVVGIGECGLDYYRTGKDTATRTKQQDVFKKHIELSLETNLPLMLHIRPTPKTIDAYDDALSILAVYGNKPRGNVHFFVGNTDIAKKFFDIGFTISFTGVITFTNAYDDVVRSAPLDMILTETDCPYAAPVPYRGTRNESVYVIEVVKRISELKDIPLEHTVETLVKNAARVFSFGF